MAAFSDAIGLVVDPLGTTLSRWRRGDDVVRFRVAPYRAYLFAHPDHIRHVLHVRRDAYERDPVHAAALARVSGNGLTASDGALWRDQRELLRPYFQRNHEGPFERSAVRCASRMVARWGEAAERGAPVDLADEMLRFSLETICEALFRAQVEEHSAVIVRDAATALGALYRAMRFPVRWMSQFGFSLDRKFRRAHRALYELANSLIDADGRDRDPDNDLLGLLSQRVERRQAADQIVTMILAGHDTTGAVLTWAVHQVAAHPEIECMLRAEARVALPDLGAGRLPIDLGRLPYAASVLKEALRLYPPAWILSRSPRENDTIDGHRIPAGASVFVSPFVTHRHPEFWPEPERFDPRRFREGSAPIHPYSYLPFGAGPRMCIGKLLAETTGQVALATITRSFRLTPTRESREVKPEARLTLHARPRLRMTVRPA